MSGFAVNVMEKVAVMMVSDAVYKYLKEGDFVEDVREIGEGAIEISLEVWEGVKERFGSWFGGDNELRIRSAKGGSDLKNVNSKVVIALVSNAVYFYLTNLDSAKKVHENRELVMEISRDVWKDVKERFRSPFDGDNRVKLRILF